MATQRWRRGVTWRMKTLAAKKRMGRPARFGIKMNKTSITMPQHLWELVEEDRKKSGFASVGEQIRYELLYHRGLWKDPVVPTQTAPAKG